MYKPMNFEQWTEYKALIRAFVAKNETLIEGDRTKYLLDLDSYSDAARDHVVTKFQNDS